MSTMVLGVGGAGSNFISRLMTNPVAGIEYALISTDSSSAKECSVVKNLLIGEIPDKTEENRISAKQVAEKSRTEVQSFIGNNSVLILTAGMGGITGTRATPLIAGFAKEKGIFTIGVVTLPYAFEGEERILRARQGMEALNSEVDVLITVHNDRLDYGLKEDASFDDAMVLANSVLAHLVKEVSRHESNQDQTELSFKDVESLFDGFGDRMKAISEIADSATPCL